MVVSQLQTGRQTKIVLIKREVCFCKKNDYPLNNSILALPYLKSTTAQNLSSWEEFCNGLAYLSPLDLSVAESDVEIAWLSVKCQDLEWECESLLPTSKRAYKKDARGMLDLLKSSCASATKDRKALHASCEDDVRSVLVLR